MFQNSFVYLSHIMSQVGKARLTETHENLVGTVSKINVFQKQKLVFHLDF